MNLIKRFLIIFFILFMGLAAYFFSTTSLFNKPLHPIDVVSGEAVFVFETTEPVMVWNQLVSQPIWERLVDIPSLKQLEDQLLSLDSLAGKSGNLENNLKGNRFVVSLHQTGKEEFGFLFSIAFSGEAHHDFIQSLAGKINPKSIHYRNYSGVRIYEYYNQPGTPILSYALVENLVIASYSSFLIEDAIRYSKTDGPNNFKAAFSELFQSSPEPEGLGVLRLGSAGVAKFIQGISRVRDLKVVDDFLKNKLSANLELKFSNSKIILDGVSFFGGGENVGLSWEEAGKSSSFANYISNRTAIYHHYDVPDILQVREIPNEAFEIKPTLKGEMEKSFQEELFFERLTGEVGYMVLEESGLLETDRILLLKTGEIDQQVALLEELNLSLAEGDRNRLGHDYYMGKEIFVIGAEDFPAHIFEGQFVGFRNTYIVAYDDILVMGNNMNAVKVFLDDVYNDNTWGKSIHHKRILERIADGAGYSFVLNVPRFWGSVVDISSPDWKVLFQKYAPQFKSIDWMIFQLKEQTTHIEFEYNMDPIKPVKDVILAEDMRVEFNEKLTYGPKAIQNFNDRSSDYLVQDELHEIHLVTDEGNIIFSQPVDGKIVGDVFQIDFYKNGKLQVLFATNNFIYAYDRLGNPLPGYPVRLPSGSVITHLNLVDYDHTRDYRYFVGTENGELYLFDKNGNNLEGWTPRNISGALATKPAHHKLPGAGDFMVAINSSGELFLMNRKGNLQTGNPIKLGDGVSTDYALIEKGSASETQLVTINEEGEVVRVNFNGELTYRNQLLRPDRDTKFHLVKDQSNNRYLFVLHEYNKVSVLNAEAAPLFEKEMFSDNLSFQFFSFGGDKNIFLVIDKVQEFIYLYDLQGELLNTMPINGYQNVEVKYSGSKNEYSILVVHENRFSEYKMPL
ncbi:MAG: hypothetical protein WD426_13035 [Anditalea sp.]